MTVPYAPIHFVIPWYGTEHWRDLTKTGGGGWLLSVNSGMWSILFHWACGQTVCHIHGTGAPDTENPSCLGFTIGVMIITVSYLIFRALIWIYSYSYSCNIPGNELAAHYSYVLSDWLSVSSQKKGSDSDESGKLQLQFQLQSCNSPEWITWLQFRNALLFIILFVRNFWRVVRNFGRVFAILFEVLSIENQEENPFFFAGWEGGGLRGAKIVNKKFVNKLAFPNNEIGYRNGISGHYYCSGKRSLW